MLAVASHCAQEGDGACPFLRPIFARPTNAPSTITLHAFDEAFEGGALLQFVPDECPCGGDADPVTGFRCATHELETTCQSPATTAYGAQLETVDELDLHAFSGPSSSTCHNRHGVKIPMGHTPTWEGDVAAEA